jgi:hypothetical protein
MLLAEAWMPWHEARVVARTQAATELASHHCHSKTKSRNLALGPCRLQLKAPGAQRKRMSAGTAKP